MIRKCSLFILLMTLFSCGQEYVYKEISRDFPQNRWAKENSKVYDITIDESNQNYDLNVLFSHIKDSPYDLIPLKLEIKGSNDFLISEHVLVRIKDSVGNDSGDCTGDYCDVAVVAIQNQPLQKGEYTVIIQNKFPGSYLPNVIAVGISLSKSLPE